VIHDNTGLSAEELEGEVSDRADSAAGVIDVVKLAARQLEQFRHVCHSQARRGEHDEVGVGQMGDRREVGDRVVRTLGQVRRDDVRAEGGDKGV